MKTASFHFDDNLFSLLPRARRSTRLQFSFNGPQSLKHLIESLGIPHTELGVLRGNGHAVDMDYLVKDGDVLEVTASTPADGVTDRPRFAVDGHLGRLAAYLRMLGFDCHYRSDSDNSELVLLAVADSRILLTRNRRLLMRKIVKHGYLPRSLDSRQQLLEVLHRFRLANWIIPFERCMRCNHPLKSVRKADVIERLEPLTRKYFEEFYMCPACGQIYWKGSHFDRMQQFISSLPQ